MLSHWEICVRLLLGTSHRYFTIALAFGSAGTRLADIHTAPRSCALCPAHRDHRRFLRPSGIRQWLDRQG